MAQHDYDIGNQSGSAFRSDLNNALSAIVSMNSGSSEPPAMYAYQLYADTANNLVKQRNSGNSGWITIGTLGATNWGLAALASPTFTGTPLAPTATAGTNTTQIATTAFVVSSYLPLTGGTVTGNITLNAQSDIRFADADSSNFVALQAPVTVASNLTLTLPATDGSSGQALTTDGSGALSFATIGGVPIGAVFYFAANTPPAGFLECNGAAVSRTTFAALFAITGTTYGSGNGSTTFNLPDLRGEFIRGWDNSRGVDTNRVFGSLQAEATQLISHTHSSTVTAYGPGGGLSSGSGSITYGAGFTELNDGDGNIIPNPHTASLTYTTGTPSTSGGTETRPRNLALLPCIKF
jgi:phage-related tail fiber protein